MLHSAPCTKEMQPFGGPGRFLLGRSEDLLPGLLQTHAGKVQLIYLDPPFATGDTFHFQIDGMRCSRPAYTDVLQKEEYLRWMRTLLTGCHALLSPTGAIYLHIDYRMSAHMRLLLDEIFGETNFVNEIIWMYKSGGRSTRHFSRKHDTIFFYRKTKNMYFDIHAVGTPRGAERRNHMKRFIDKDGRVAYSIRSNGKTYVYHEDMPVYPSDVWMDIEHLHQRDPERTGYATQKPEALLRRIVLASSKPGDIVVDLFSGSGTTAAVCAQTGREYLVCDSSPYALYSLRARLNAANAAYSLFDAHVPMTFTLPATFSSDINVDFQSSRAGENLSCTLCAYKLPSGQTAPLLYCSLGHIQGNTYHPLVQTHQVTLPLTLHMPVCDAPALQTMDADGQMRIWKIE
ncbi:site-specific DNA-methyltransferase [Christensenellaceae bacterium OttesenSCG-928-L17]|nr:site-specific DNA-methyltransferase [Christensenellaceae bacterium OttesenSCG-928-L17]